MANIETAYDLKSSDIEIQLLTNHCDNLDIVNSVVKRFSSMFLLYKKCN